MTAIYRAADALILSRYGRNLGLADRPGAARAVFESIDVDELARVLCWASAEWSGYDYDGGLPCDEHLFQAEVAKRHLLSDVPTLTRAREDADARGDS